MLLETEKKGNLEIEINQRRILMNHQIKKGNYVLMKEEEVILIWD